MDALKVFHEIKENTKNFSKDDSNISLDISKSKINDLYKFGQHPKVCILTCSDSRVIPEYIFGLKLGEGFIIRCAGGMASDYTLSSISYAHEHLKVKLFIILAHTKCGAIGATIDAHEENFITRTIRGAIGDSKDEKSAIDKCLEYNYKKLKEILNDDALVIKAVYQTQDGGVKFYED